MAPPAARWAVVWCLGLSVGLQPRVLGFIVSWLLRFAVQHYSYRKRRCRGSLEQGDSGNREGATARGGTATDTGENESSMLLVSVTVQRVHVLGLALGGVELQTSDGGVICLGSISLGRSNRAASRVPAQVASPDHLQREDPSKSIAIHLDGVRVSLGSSDARKSTARSSADTLVGCIANYRKTHGRDVVPGGDKGTMKRIVALPVLTAGLAWCMRRVAIEIGDLQVDKIRGDVSSPTGVDDGREGDLRDPSSQSLLRTQVEDSFWILQVTGLRVACVFPTRSCGATVRYGRMKVIARLNVRVTTARAFRRTCWLARSHLPRGKDDLNDELHVILRKVFARGDFLPAAVRDGFKA